MKREVIFVLLWALLFWGCKEKTVAPIENNTQIKNTANLSTPEIKELNELIYPIDGADPNLNENDLIPLSEIGKAQIVGLGEATHGTKEFFQLKYRIFKYLVKNYGFNIFAFEADMGESYYIDKYVTRGEGSLNDIMLDKMHFWTWRTEEVANLLIWMKNYNESLNENDKIHLIGVDCQFLTFQPSLLHDYFSEVDASKRVTIDSLYEIFIKISPQDRRNFIENADTQTIDNLKILIENAKQEFIDNKMTLVSNSSEFYYEFHLRLLQNMEQTIQTIINKSFNYRDKYMAENAIWCSNLLKKNKVAVWAHNAHIAKNPFYLTGSMGYYLKNTLETEYKTIGFSFSKGSFNAVTYNENNTYGGVAKQTISAEPKKDSFNELLYNAKVDNFIFILNDIPLNSELDRYFESAKDFLIIGAVYSNNPLLYYQKFDIRKLYDVIINYDITTEAIKY